MIQEASLGSRKERATRFSHSPDMKKKNSTKSQSLTKMRTSTYLIVFSLTLNCTCSAAPLFKVGDDFKLEKVAREPAREFHVGDLVETTMVTGSTRRGKVVDLGKATGSALVTVHYDKPASSDVMYDSSKDKLYLVSTTVIPITEPTPESIREVALKFSPDGNLTILEITKPSKNYFISGGCFGRDQEVEGWTVKLSQGNPIVVYRDYDGAWCAQEEPHQSKDLIEDTAPGELRLLRGNSPTTKPTILKHRSRLE